MSAHRVRTHYHVFLYVIQALTTCVDWMHDNMRDHILHIAQMLAFARHPYLLLSAAALPFWVDLLRGLADRNLKKEQRDGQGAVDGSVPPDCVAALMDLAGQQIVKGVHLVEDDLKDGDIPPYFDGFQVRLCCNGPCGATALVVEWCLALLCDAVRGTMVWMCSKDQCPNTGLQGLLRCVSWQAGTDRARDCAAPARAGHGRGCEAAGGGAAHVCGRQRRRCHAAADAARGGGGVFGGGRHCCG